MRRDVFRMPDAAARGLLAASPFVHVATTSPDGRPIFRTVNAVVLGDAVAFHGAPAGEKMDALGREAVVTAQDVVATVPSYFLDPERACPATTLYRSVQAHGVLTEVRDLCRKAAVLQALMEKHQPEGGHQPIAADNPLYTKALDGLLVAEVSLTNLDGKAKLGQHLPPATLGRVVHGLWNRGAPGDARAVELVREASPHVPAPATMRAPEGYHLHVWLPEGRAAEAATLLEGAYWLGGVRKEEVVRSHLASAAWVGATDGQGRLVASARALSDGARVAWIMDVIVAPAHRRNGLGRALVSLLLDHPEVRDARVARLRTVDQQKLYAGLGFTPAPATNPLGAVEMLRERGR